MNTSPRWLALGMLMLLFWGCDSPPSDAEWPEEEVIEIGLLPLEPESAENAVFAQPQSVAERQKPAKPKGEPTQPAAPPLTTPATATIPQTAIQSATQLAQQTLLYSANPEDLRDCSGILHRVLTRVNQQCASLAVPQRGQHRSSRAIAQWYEQQGLLRWLEAPVTKYDIWIQPGNVLFYGRGRAIHHTGIVVDVERDAAGQVTNYGLFHGRSQGRPAAITRYHHRQPTRKSYPPLGNGSQALVAVARLCAGASCVCPASDVTPPPTLAGRGL